MTLLLGLCLVGLARAQSFPVYEVVYRPPGVRYFVLPTPHFDVIFEEGAEAQAREAAAILEGELPAAQALVGSRRRLRMPVVLNRFNDRANGFVSAFPFKQEIEGVGIKGSRLSARFRTWTWAVASHELVHAVHAQSGTGFGVGEVLRWFSPDLTRSLNLTLPDGIVEGAAVYHESRIQEGAGRLNFSLFQMQFRAAMLAERPWSLAQLLETPAYSVPINRFYVGGSNFFKYLADQDSARFFQRSTALHYRFPFLGHGIELWYGTGKSPRRLGREFRAAMRRREQARVEALGPLTETRLVAGRPGREHRRPRWLDDSTLVAYAAGYDVRPGFYRIDARTGRRTLISHQDLTEDFYFSLTEDRAALLFARYVPDTFAPVKALAEVFRLDLATGRATALTRAGRALAPVEAQGTVWALQNDGPFNQWVRLEADGRLAPVTDYRRALFVHLAPSPVEDAAAVVLNVRGRQGVFRATFDAGGRPTLAPWLLFDDASIYDAAWSADGRYLLFTADPGGIANVYALDTRTDRLLKLTNVAFGALEPSLSPDGRTLAFVHYRHERYDLVQISFDPDRAEAVPRRRADAGRATPWTTWLSENTEPRYDGAEVRPYRAGRYLAPRMLYPTVRYEDVSRGPGDTDLGVGVGLAVQGADPLERWAYAAEAFYQDERAWGRLTLSTASTVARPFLTLSALPATLVVGLVDSTGQVVGTRRVGRERRSAALGLRLPVVLSSNVFTTTAGLTLRGAFEQERLFDADGRTLRPFQDRLRLTPAAFLAYRLQANRRDVIPNTGTVLTVSAEVDAWRERGTPRRSLIAQLTQYVPVSLRRHTGLRLRAGLLTQNQGGIYTLDLFLPRGYENEFLGAGTYVRLNLETLQPLWYLDDGLVILPLYVKVLYAYGFVEAVFPVEGTARRDRFSAVGAGLGLQLRVFYLFDFDLRFGASYLLEAHRITRTFR